MTWASALSTKPLSGNTPPPMQRPGNVAGGGVSLKLVATANAATDIMEGAVKLPASISSAFRVSLTVIFEESACVFADRKGIAHEEAIRQLRGDLDKKVEGIISRASSVYEESYIRSRNTNRFEPNTTHHKIALSNTLDTVLAEIDSLPKNITDRPKVVARIVEIKDLRPRK